MEDTENVGKVHDIYPDSQDDAYEAQEDSSQSRRPSVNGVINPARPRPIRIPRPVSHSYPAFKGKQQFALKIGIHEMWDEELRKSTGLSHVEITHDMLTLYTSPSQSKLSQQELIELQKATHFDKKELQQWYKGTSSLPTELADHAY